jgi:hypothetical protein
MEFALEPFARRKLCIEIGAAGLTVGCGINGRGRVLQLELGFSGLPRGKVVIGTSNVAHPRWFHGVALRGGSLRLNWVEQGGGRRWRGGTKPRTSLQGRGVSSGSSRKLLNTRVFLKGGSRGWGRSSAGQGRAGDASEDDASLVSPTAWQTGGATSLTLLVGVVEMLAVGANGVYTGWSGEAPSARQGGTFSTPG